MKKVLLSCMAFAAGAAVAIAQDEPVYPSSLDFTLNGEKELSGVSVSQTMVKESLTIDITGESDATAITMDFVTPEGWDYALIGSIIGDLDNPFKTRSSHWLPVSLATQQGYKKGNSFSFPADGTGCMGTIYLVNGNNVWEYPIDVNFNVKHSGGSDDPVVDAPTFPESIGIKTSSEGLSVWQGEEDDVYTIKISGKPEEPTFDVVLSVPEGWDGFISLPYDDSIVIGESVGAQRKTRSIDPYWVDIDEAYGWGCEKGNVFTFTPNGEKQDVLVYLYKGNMVDAANWISLEYTEEENADPAFPENFIVDTFPEGLEVTQGYNKWGNYDIEIKGEVSASTFSVVVDIPEGWDGFVCKNWSHEGDVTITETNPNPRGTRAEEIEWISVESLLAKGYEKGNRFTFEPTFVPTSNNYQTIELHLYKGEMAIEEDMLTLLVYVSKGEAEAPELPTFPDTFDLTTDSSDVTIWQGSYENISESGIELTQDEIDALSMFMPEKAIVLNGTTENGSLTVDFNLPQGWEGVLPVKVSAADGNEGINPLATRANAFEPYPMEEFLEMMQWMSSFDTSITPGKQLTFPLDGKKQVFGCLLYLHDDGTLAGSPDYAGDYLDAANAFVLVLNVNAGAETTDLEYPEHLDFTLNGEASLPGVTVSQEMIPLDGNDYLTISITGTSDADEITIDMTTPEGWDGMLTSGEYGEEEDENIEPTRVKVKMDEDSWIPLMFASWMGLTESNTLTFSVDDKEHKAMVFLIKDDNYYAVNIDFIFEVSKAGGSAVEGLNAADSNVTYYDMNGNKIAKPAKGVYVKVTDGKATKIVGK